MGSKGKSINKQIEVNGKLMYEQGSNICLYGHPADVSGCSRDMIYKENYRYSNVFTQLIAMYRRCHDPRYHEKYPTYKSCTTSINKFLDFYNYVTTNSPNVSITYSIDKDSIWVNNKIYDFDNILILPMNLNRQLFSIDTCSNSNQECLNGNKYQLLMNINSRPIHFGQYSTKEELYLQKSITNAYKSLRLFKLSYEKGDITIHTYNKFLMGEVYRYWETLSNQILPDHKEKIDELLK